MNDYNAFAQNQYPERFSGLLQVDERWPTRGRFSPRSTRGSAARPQGPLLRAGFLPARLRAQPRPCGFRAVLGARRRRRSCRSSSSSPARRPTTGRATSATCRARPRDAAAARHTLPPRHGPAGRAFRRGGRWDFPPEVLAAYKRDNLQMEVMFPITWGGRWDYPYLEAQELIRGMRDLFGARSSSGAPTCRTSSGSAPTGRASTTSRNYCSFLTSGEKGADPRPERGRTDRVRRPDGCCASELTSAVLSRTSCSSRRGRRHDAKGPLDARGLQPGDHERPFDRHRNRPQASPSSCTGPRSPRMQSSRAKGRG